MPSCGDAKSSSGRDCCTLLFSGRIAASSVGGLARAAAARWCQAVCALRLRLARRRGVRYFLIVRRQNSLRSDPGPAQLTGGQLSAFQQVIGAVGGLADEARYWANAPQFVISQRRYRLGLGIHLYLAPSAKLRGGLRDKRVFSDCRFGGEKIPQLGAIFFVDRC